MDKNKLSRSINIALISSFVFGACAPVNATEDGNTFNDESKSKNIQPAPKPQFEPLPTPSIYSIPVPEKPDVATPENLLVDNCVLPFVGARMVSGLRFGMPIVDDNGKQMKDKEGRPIWHLGQDFDGNKPGGGEIVVNMCKSTVLFTGDVSEGAPITSESQKTLGNVFVALSKYLDENGTENEMVIVYAHLKEVSDIVPGTVLNPGEAIGILGNTGGGKNAHLHVHMWTKEAWDTIMNSEDIAGNILRMSGFYPDSEHNIGQIENEFIDPRKFLLSHTNTK